MNLLPLSALALTDHKMSSRKVNIDIKIKKKKKKNSFYSILLAQKENNIFRIFQASSVVENFSYAP